MGGGIGDILFGIILAVSDAAESYRNSEEYKLAEKRRIRNRRLFIISYLIFGAISSYFRYYNYKSAIEYHVPSSEQYKYKLRSYYEVFKYFLCGPFLLPYAIYNNPKDIKIKSITYWNNKNRSDE